ncbi:MAG: GDP-mannose 4,6-dehydratase, partial [Muribaculaceae bacterium]
SCYDEGKRCAETLCMDFHRQHDLQVKIIRIFNTYGPKMLINDGRVVSNFVAQALKNENITIYGDGNQTRSLQYIDDLIEGMICMMNTDKDLTGPINIGNPNEYTINELASLIIKMTNSSSKIIYSALPSDDPKQRNPDISLAKDKLNWEPKIQLNEGLSNVINYFKTII